MSSSSVSDKVRASHILIKHQGSRRKASWKDSEGRVISNTTRKTVVSQLKSLREDIVSGKAKFKDVASRYSDCSSAKRDGDLATILLQLHHNQLVATTSARPILTVLKDILHARVKVNSTGAKVLEYISDFGKPSAPLPAAIVACVPKKVHVDGIGESEFKIVPTEIISAIKEGLQEPIEAETELEVPKELITSAQWKN